MGILSERLKTLRENKGVTQSEIAEYLGISRATYTMYETGRSEPKPERLERIAKYFSVPVDHLTGNDLDKTDIIIQKLIELTEEEKIIWKVLQKKEEKDPYFGGEIESILNQPLIKRTDFDYYESYVFNDNLKYYLLMKTHDFLASSFLIIAHVKVTDNLLNLYIIDLIIQVDNSQKENLSNLHDIVEELNMSDEMKSREKSIEDIINDLEFISLNSPQE